MTLGSPEKIGKILRVANWRGLQDIFAPNPAPMAEFEIQGKKRCRRAVLATSHFAGAASGNRT
jgi:hypothetical protein